MIAPRVMPLPLSSTFALLPGRGLPEELCMSQCRGRQLGRGRQGVQDRVL